MSTAASTGLALVGVLAALWLLAGLLARHLQGLLLLVSGRAGVASAGYDLIVLPGVVLHELAHLVLAFVLRVRIVRADLFRFRRPGDSRQGEVIVERVDPLRMSLVGAAPLLAGVPALLLLLRSLHIPLLDLSPATLDLLHASLSRPWSIPGLYLLWAIANTMFPSSADRAAWPVVAVTGGAIFAVMLFAGYTPALPSAMAARLIEGGSSLVGGLLPVVALDLCLLVVIAQLTRLAGHLTGRRLVRSRS